MLVVDKISKQYHQDGKALPVLKDISFTVSDGEFVALRGRSGSGKSTLLNILGLLAQPDSGTIALDGKNVVGLTENEAADTRAHQLGFVFQSFNLLPHLTALENITLAAVRPETQAAIALLERFGLADRSAHLPGQLSGGEQQRVALARALINEPSLILADEPTGNLDEESEAVVLTELRHAASSGCGVLVVSHSNLVAAAADRTIRLVRGQLVTEDQESTA